MSHLALYRVSHALWKAHIPLLPHLLARLHRLLSGAVVPPSCTIGHGSKLAYGGRGVVIHARAVVGRDCVISPGVVIGGRSGYSDVPHIGDRVLLWPGAKVLGPVVVGDGAQVGANAVLIESAPAGSIYVAPLGRFLEELT